MLGCPLSGLTQHPEHGAIVSVMTRLLGFAVEGAYTQQGRAHIRRLHPDWAARPALMSRAAHAVESKVGMFYYCEALQRAALQLQGSISSGAPARRGVPTERPPTLMPPATSCRSCSESAFACRIGESTKHRCTSASLLSKGILRKKNTSSGTNPPGVSLNRLELKKQMRYFFRAKTFCVLQKNVLGKFLA
jgi:hypothetical protein